MSQKKILIVGAGPAGISAGAALSSRGIQSVIVELGKNIKERDHNLAEDLGMGIGGAGVFSDGKFSYYPSGTKIYDLENKSNLKISHKWLESHMDKCGINYLKYENIDEKHKIDASKQNFIEKKYPSFYGDLEQRKNLISNIEGEIKGSILTDSKLIKLSKVQDKYKALIFNQKFNEKIEMLFDGVILATGRIADPILNSIIDDTISIKRNKLRYEFGIRLETLSSESFLSKKENPDVKCIWNTNIGQIRTFCTCRSGEIWNIPYDSISALSGRSDGPKTEYSNFGYLVRFANEHFSIGEKIWQEIWKNKHIKSGYVIWEELDSYLDNKIKSNNPIVPNSRPWYPKDKFIRKSLNYELSDEFNRVIKEALNYIFEIDPGLNNPSTAVLFPAIEGVGYYAELENNMKLMSENIYFVGDLNGSFRGIIPAFLSGYYAGLEIK